jgi:hypothetical protein
MKPISDMGYGWHPDPPYSDKQQIAIFIYNIIGRHL